MNTGFDYDLALELLEGKARAFELVNLKRRKNVGKARVLLRKYGLWSIFEADDADELEEETSEPMEVELNAVRTNTAHELLKKKWMTYGVRPQVDAADKVVEVDIMPAESPSNDFKAGQLLELVRTYRNQRIVLCNQMVDNHVDMLPMARKALAQEIEAADAEMRYHLKRFRHYQETGILLKDKEKALVIEEITDLEVLLKKKRNAASNLSKARKKQSEGLIKKWTGIARRIENQIHRIKES